jgi:2-dehydropantoate 2-reductase
MDIAIIGTGGIGGYYGARLAHGGHRVHFLLRSEYEAVKQNGLAVDSCLGDFSVAAPLVYRNVGDMPPCDLVCVSVKSTANDGVFPLLGAAAKDGGSVLLLQNGFGNEEKLARHCPAARVFAGLCFICSFRDGPGRIRHTAYGRLSLAPLREEDAGKTQGLAALFERAGVETETHADLLLARWRKLVWNIPYNGLCVVMGCRTDGLANNPSMRVLVRSVMEEVIDAGQACGFDIPYSFAEEMAATTDVMPPYDPSMRLDALAGRQMEIDAIYANPAAFADAHGYDMKYTKMIRRQLEAIEHLASGTVKKENP